MRLALKLADFFFFIFVEEVGLTAISVFDALLEAPSDVRVSS